MFDLKATSNLKAELIGLIRYMERVKHEIAAVYRPTDSEFGFDSGVGGLYRTG